MQKMTVALSAVLFAAACHGQKTVQPAPAPVTQSSIPATRTDAAAAAPSATTRAVEATPAAAAPAAKAEQRFSCPMHADITAKEPGKCSKCGMALVADSAPSTPAH